MQKDAQAVVMAYDSKRQTKIFTQRVQMAVGAELGVVGLGGDINAHIPTHRARVHGAKNGTECRLIFGSWDS